MTTTNQSPVVIAALDAAIADAPERGDATVFRYLPSLKDAEAREYVTLAVSVDGVQMFTSATAAIKSDSYNIHGQISVTMPGTGDSVAEAVQVRCSELMSMIERVCREDPSLGQAHTTVVAVDSYDYKYGGDDRSRSVLCDFTVGVKQRLIG